MDLSKRTLEILEITNHQKEPKRRFSAFSGINKSPRPAKTSSFQVTVGTESCAPEACAATSNGRLFVGPGHWA